MSTLTRIAKTETRLMLRDATSAFFGVVFPGLLLVTLALVLPGFRDVIDDPEAPAELIGLRPVDIYVPVVLALAIATVGLTILPAYLAAYREQGVLRRLSTTPAAPRDLLGAQVLVNLGFLAVGSLIAVLAGGIAFDVDWPSNIPSLVLAFMLATVASFGIGLVIAAVVPSARAASGVGTIVYFPMLFFAGVWTPGATMPDAARNVADFTPIGAASEAIADAWSGAWPTPLHLAVLVGCAVVASAAAARLFRWE
jgi:ABC-2 type transport system permease protein